MLCANMVNIQIAFILTKNYFCVSFEAKRNFTYSVDFYWTCNLSMYPRVRLSVGWSVCKNFLERPKVMFPGSFIYEHLFDLVGTTKM